MDNTRPQELVVLTRENPYQKQKQTRLEQVAMQAEALAHEIGNNVPLMFGMTFLERAMFSSAQKSIQAAAIALNALARKD